MNIQTNTQNRKVLAQELSRLIGEEVQYLGAPSMAYRVGPYTINRDGSVSGDDFEAIHSFLVENNYVHETIGVNPEEENAPAAPQEETNGVTDENTASIDGMSVCIPLKDYTPLGLSCLLKTLYSRQALINAMTQSECLFIDQELIDRLYDEKPDSAKRIQEILEDEIRAEMVKGIAIEDGKIKMDFPFDEAHPTRWQAFAELFLRIDKHSRVAHHAATKKMAPGESEMKYFCRNWLMQLGMGGPEHKENRAVLLNHLTGYAAFRTADKMDAHKARVSQRRKEAREAKTRSGADSEAAPAEEVSEND